jgi:hypothetical protein
VCNVSDGADAELAWLGDGRRGRHCLWGIWQFIFSLPTCGTHKQLNMNDYISTATGCQLDI